MLDEALKEFARWAIRSSAWEGCELDGSDVEERAIKLGLIVETKYDPTIHGEPDCDVEPGDVWYVFAPELSAPNEKD